MREQDLTGTEIELLAAEADAVTYHLSADGDRAVLCWCRSWHSRVEAGELNKALSRAFRSGYAQGGGRR